MFSQVKAPDIAPPTQRPAPIRGSTNQLILGVQLCALVLSLGIAPNASADNWVYNARKGDNLWVLAKEYLTSMRYWSRFLTLNAVPDPRRLKPGTPIRIPVEWLRFEPVPAVIDA